MTDYERNADVSKTLTRQLKKGELLPDDLYWVKHDGIINILDNLEISLTDVDEVLAPVPTFDEWQAKLEENAQLKELLKKCRHIIGVEKDFATCHFGENTLVKLLTEIDEVLK